MTVWINSNAKDSHQTAPTDGKLSTLMTFQSKQTGTGVYTNYRSQATPKDTNKCTTNHTSLHQWHRPLYTKDPHQSVPMTLHHIPTDTYTSVHQGQYTRLHNDTPLHTNTYKSIYTSSTCDCTNTCQSTPEKRQMRPHQTYIRAFTKTHTSAHQGTHHSTRTDICQCTLVPF